MPQRSLFIIECDQSCNRPLLSVINKQTIHSISDPEPFLHNLCSESFEYPHTNPCINIAPLNCTSGTKQIENPYIHCTEALERQRHSEPAEDSQILPRYEYNTPTRFKTPHSNQFLNSPDRTCFSP